MMGSHDVFEEDAPAPVVSPELALVDPELAASERQSLPVPVALLALAAPEARASARNDGAAPESPPMASPAREERREARVQRRRRRMLPLLAGVAAALVATLLLLDIRVGVGPSRPSVEPTTPDPAKSATPSNPRSLPKKLPSRSKPQSSPKLQVRPSPKLQVRRFAWAPVKGATGYRVEIHDGSRLILARKTNRPEVVVPRTWRNAGTRQALRPGKYLWYVWPIESGRRSTRAVVQATLSIPDS